MIRKVCLTLAIVLVFGLVGTVFAGYFTNAQGNGEWCDPNNWIADWGEPPGTGVPSPNEVCAWSAGVPEGDININCDTAAKQIWWQAYDSNDVNHAQALTIEAGASLTVTENLGFYESWGRVDFAPTVNVYGDLSIDLDSNFNNYYTFIGPADGNGSLNIYPGANIWCSGIIRGADNEDGRFNVYMEGGDVNCLNFRIGEEGIGDFIMKGGTFRTRDPGDRSFEISRLSSVSPLVYEFEVLIDGGAELYVEGTMSTPSSKQQPEAAAVTAHINIDNGTISCDEWAPAGDLWTLDINEGSLRIRDSVAATQAKVEGWILDGRITGLNGTRRPQILWEGNDIVVLSGFSLLTAWAPKPYHGEQDVPRDVNLSWLPGSYIQNTNGHEVFFGTSWDDVNDMTEPCSVQDACEYDPGLLEFETTYYWRVDEINDANVNSPWKGPVWKFTVPNFIELDDFEDYNDTDQIFNTWIEDGGAWLDLGSGGDPAHGGSQSMYFFYSNNANYGGGYYSEVGKALDGMDFTEAGIKALTLYFYGNAGNAAGSTEEPYVGIDDGSTYAESRYTDTGNPTSDIQEAEWHEWNVAISDLNTVTLTNVQNIYVGFGQRGGSTPGGTGEVFFDDIALYITRCVAELGPAYDFSGDCIVGLAEIALMGEEWLMGDRVLDTITPPDPCVLHYKFDETSGSLISDYSGNGDDGTAFDDVDQSPAEIARMDPGKSGNSFHFSVPLGEMGVMIPPEVFTDNGIAQEISVGVWIKNAYTYENPDAVAYMLEFRQWDGVSPDANDRVLAVEITDNGDTYTLHDDSNSTSYDLNWNRYHTYWNHYAFVRDENNLKIYVNGYLESVGGSSGTPMETPGLLYIGISADRAPGHTSPLHDGFTGNLDDFMIFDYALSDAQAGHLGTGGTGYIPINAPMNISDNEAQGQEVVNFKDYAELMLYWLDEQLWP